MTGANTPNGVNAPAEADGFDCDGIGFCSVLLLLRCWRPCRRAPPNGASAPLQRHSHISRHSAGKINDFDLQLVSALTEVLGPELIDLLRHAGQRVFPARFLLIDGAPAVGAELVREAMDLHLGAAVAHRALDDLDGALNRLFIGKAGWLAELI